MLIDWPHTSYEFAFISAYLQFVSADCALTCWMLDTACRLAIRTPLRLLIRKAIALCATCSAAAGRRSSLGAQCSVLCSGASEQPSSTRRAAGSGLAGLWAGLWARQAMPSKPQVADSTPAVQLPHPHPLRAATPRPQPPEPEPLLPLPPSTHQHFAHGSLRCTSFCLHCLATLG
jgi:hypothetical protein